jgi:hypothetical protein
MYCNKPLIAYKELSVFEKKYLRRYFILLNSLGLLALGGGSVYWLKKKIETLPTNTTNRSHLLTSQKAERKKNKLSYIPITITMEMTVQSHMNYKNSKSRNEHKKTILLF